MVKRTFSSPLTPLFSYLLPLTHFNIVSHHWFRNTIIKACPRVCDLDQVVVGSEWRKKKKKEKIRDKNPKMGRGKIEIKMIENATNRQVTFSKRRSGILKKAEELSVLCDAQVLLVMATPNNKAFDYCTPGTNIKSMVDRYQGSARVDLWEGPYKKQLADQMKINNDLRKEIRQRRGEELCDMDVMELHRLDEDLYETANMVRQKIKKKLDVQENTRKKKVRSLREANRNLEAQLRYMEMQNYSCYVGHAPEDNQYNIAALSLSNGVDVYDAAEAMEEYKAAAAVGLTPDVVGHGSLAFRLQPNQPNLHHMGYGLRDLRLA